MLPRKPAWPVSLKHRLEVSVASGQRFVIVAGSWPAHRRERSRLLLCSDTALAGSGALASSSAICAFSDKTQGKNKKEPPIKTKNKTRTPPQKKREKNHDLIVRFCFDFVFFVLRTKTSHCTANKMEPSVQCAFVCVCGETKIAEERIHQVVRRNGL